MATYNFPKTEMLSKDEMDFVLALIDRLKPIMPIGNVCDSGDIPVDHVRQFLDLYLVKAAYLGEPSFEKNKEDV